MATALVQTVDFFTPVVDDPEAFGAIAAANALSDVYAMGGRPLTALSIAAFPEKDFPLEWGAAIFRGGLAKLREAGCVLMGGHTVRDPEIKFGYAVTGLVDPEPDSHQRHGAPRGRRRPDEAPRHRGDRHGLEGGSRPRGGCRRGDPVDGDAQQGRRSVGAPPRRSWRQPT